ncbi:MAG: hypothetical protein ISS28_01800 [Candidatus Cloacimonetes bacterium]|nr:hypothetical protein [Candidatus Cloacimonadota bacterium]MBL7085822.1 hypothetical protein [Candidatus Cloacimonadota bacterium]
MTEIIGIWIAAFLTLCMFSFLYKENPFYRFAEHLFVGCSMGYFIPYTYYNVFIPYTYNPLFLRKEYILIIPFIIGLLYWLRFSGKYSWLSRYPIAFGLGIVGMGVPMSMHASVLVQMRSMMLPLDNINIILIFIGTITILLYFFFSKAHTGIYGRFTSIGIWFMMVGFGASFGYTVMARISLLIGRVQFLLEEWLHIIK